MAQHRPESIPEAGGPRVGRRAFLRAAALTLTLPSAAALLAACGGTASTATVPATTAPSVAPSIAPSVAPTAGVGAAATTAPAGTATRAAATAASAGTPTADGLLPSPLPGVPDAYTKLPAPFKTVNAVPRRAR